MKDSRDFVWSLTYHSSSTTIYVAGCSGRIRFIRRLRYHEQTELTVFETEFKAVYAEKQSKCLVNDGIVAFSDDPVGGPMFSRYPCLASIFVAFSTFDRSLSADSAGDRNSKGMLWYSINGVAMQTRGAAYHISDLGDGGMTPFRASHSLLLLSALFQ